jgi:hypothetical protein
MQKRLFPMWKQLLQTKTDRNSINVQITCIYLADKLTIYVPGHFYGRRNNVLFFFLSIYTAYLTLYGQGSACYWYNEISNSRLSMIGENVTGKKPSEAFWITTWQTKRYRNIFTYNINKIVSRVFNQYADEKYHGVLMRRIFFNIYFFFSVWFISCVYLYSYGTPIFSWKA